MALSRKIALRLLLAVLSVAILGNSPAWAEVDICLCPHCPAKPDPAGEDPCGAATESRPGPSLASHAEAGGCGSCIQIPLLNEAGKSIRPGPGPDGSQFPALPASAYAPARHATASAPRHPACPPPRDGPLLARLRGIRLQI